MRLGLVALACAVFLSQAQAGSEAKPEIIDPTGDQRSSSIVPPLAETFGSVETDFDKVWVEREDVDGIEFKLHMVCGCDDGADTTYQITLSYNGKEVRPAARECEPVAPASDVRCQGNYVAITVPHSALPGTAYRGWPLSITNVTARSVTTYGVLTGTTVDYAPPETVAVYTLGSQARVGTPLSDPPPPTGPVSTPGEAGPLPTHAVNLLFAEDHGCSSDTFTGADLRATVRIDGNVVLSSYGNQAGNPYFATMARMDVTSPVTLEVQVEEAEPGGFLGLQDEFHECDVVAGGGSRFSVRWDGSNMRLDSKGDGDLAARVVLMVGQGAPRIPSVKVIPGATDATLEWGDENVTRKLAAGGYGWPFYTFPGQGTGVSWRGLCDNTEYGAFRLVLEKGDWNVASPSIRFKTANLPPAPPILTSVEEGGRRRIRFEEPTPHDVVRYEVMGWNGSSNAWQLVATVPGTARYDFRLEVSSDRNVTSYHVRAWDSGGLSTVSEPFAVGAPGFADVLAGAAACPLPPKEKIEYERRPLTPEPTQTSSPDIQVGSSTNPGKARPASFSLQVAFVGVAVALVGMSRRQ